MLKQPNVAGNRACAWTLFLSVNYLVFLAINHCILCRHSDRFLFRKPYFQLTSLPKSNYLIHTSFALNMSKSSTKQTQLSLSTTNKTPITPAITAIYLNSGVACACTIINDYQIRSGRESEATSMNSMKNRQRKQDLIISKLRILKVLLSQPIFYLIVKMVGRNFTNVGYRSCRSQIFAFQGIQITRMEGSSNNLLFSLY